MKNMYNIYIYTCYTTGVYYSKGLSSSISLSQEYRVIQKIFAPPRPLLVYVCIYPKAPGRGDVTDSLSQFQISCHGYTELY